MFLEITIAEGVLLALLVVALVAYFRHPDLTPICWSVIVALSWFLGSSGMLLLPIDIAHAASFPSEAHGSAMLILWRGTYWSTFILAWVFLPVAYEYLYAGDLFLSQRVLSAIKVLCANILQL